MDVHEFLRIHTLIWVWPRYRTKSDQTVIVSLHLRQNPDDDDTKKKQKKTKKTLGVHKKHLKNVNFMSENHLICGTAH